MKNWVTGQGGCWSPCREAVSFNPYPHWREREVNERLVEYMTHAFQALFATTDRSETTPRIQAALGDQPALGPVAGTLPAGVKV